MNKKVLKTAIAICWVVLVVCFVIKLFGGKYFDIHSTDDTFNSVCTFVDNHLWLQNILAFFTNLLTVILINLAVLQQRVLRAKQFLWVIVTTIIEFAIVIAAELLGNKAVAIVGFVASIIPRCICPLILSHKFLRSFSGYILYVAFQGVSVVVKGLAITQINSESTLVALIYGIDLYIMLILYYLCANLHRDNKQNEIKEKENNNG